MASTPAPRPSHRSSLTTRSAGRARSYRAGWAALALIGLTASTVLARSHRVDQVPNGAVSGCATCHVSGAGGGDRNGFGFSVESSHLSVVDEFGDVLWGPGLAQTDSDGDGFTNGYELGDPDGLWATGDPAPVFAATNPGDAASQPPPPEPTEFYGEWQSFGFVDLIQTDPRYMGFGASRIIPEGPITGRDGNPIAVTDLQPDDSIVAEVAPSTEPGVYHAFSIRVDPPGDYPWGKLSYNTQVRTVSAGEILTGDYHRPVMAAATFHDDATGQDLAFADIQYGDFVEYTVSMTNLGHWISAVVRNRDPGPQSEPQVHQWTEIASYEDPNQVYLSTQTLVIGANTQVTDSGAPVDLASIAPNTPLIIHHSPDNWNVAASVEVVPEETYPEDPNAILVRYDYLDGNRLSTFEYHPHPLAWDASITFADGSAATVGDLDGRRAHVSVINPPQWHWGVGHYIDWITLDPIHPAPTELYNEYHLTAHLDRIDQIPAQVGWGWARVVVEGDVLAPDESPMALGDLKPGDRVLMDVIPTTDPELYYAQTIWLDLGYNPPQSYTRIHAEVRGLDGADLIIGDFLRPVSADAVVLDDATGQALSLADLTPGDLVDLTIQQTDVGDVIVRLARNPVVDPLAEGWEYDAELAFVEPPGLVWLAGPTYTVAADVPITDLDGLPVDLATVPPQSPIIVDHDAGNHSLALAVQVVPEDHYPDRPYAALQRFGSFVGTQLHTVEHGPRPLARDADITFGDGTPATVADLTAGPVRVYVNYGRRIQPQLGDVIHWVIIDPLAPEPTEIYGEWSGAAYVDLVDVEHPTVGFGSIRVVVEGEILDLSGQPIGVADLQPGDVISFEGTPSADRGLFYAQQIWIDPFQEHPPSWVRMNAPVRSVEGGDILVGDFVRPVMTDAELVDQSSGATLDLADFQPGDLVEFTVVQTEFGEYLSRLVRNPQAVPEPGVWVADIDLAFYEPPGLVYLAGPTVTVAAETPVTDFDGAPTDLSTISPQTRIAIDFDPANHERALAVQVLPEDYWPDRPDVWVQRFYRLEGDRLYTADESPRALVREAEITFGDGSPATVDDLVPGPVRVSVLRTSLERPVLWELIDWIIIDPQAPEPTEIYGEWSGAAYVDLIDVAHPTVGFGSIRVVVEGEILDQQGQPIGVADLQPGDVISAEGSPSVDRGLFYAQQIWIDPHNEQPQSWTRLNAPVRSVEGGDILIGDFLRPVMADAELLDQSTGATLTLADFQPGDLVEFTEVNTDFGQYLSRLVRHPDIEPQPQGWVDDRDLTHFEPPRLVWLAGPTFTLSADAPVTDSDGATLDLAGIAPHTRLAIDVDPANYDRALAVQILPDDQWPDRPDVWVQRFYRLDGNRLHTGDENPQVLVREVEITFGDGSPATIDDLAPGPVRVSVLTPGWERPSLWQLIDWIIIDPPAPEPTEIYGEWSGLAHLDVIDPDRREVGWGAARLVIEGEVLGRDGQPLVVDDLIPGNRLMADVIPSVDPSLYFAQQVWVDPDFEPPNPRTTLHAVIRAVEDGDVLIGEFVRQLLAGAEVLDQSTGELLAVADLHPGDLVEYTVVQTDIGDYVSRLVRNPEVDPEPDGWVSDAELAFVGPSGLVWLQGPTLTVTADALYTDSTGEPVDPSAIDAQTPIAIDHDAADFNLATAVEVVPEGHWPDRPGVSLLRFDRLVGNRLYTVDYWARPLARDAEISFGDGSPATVEDLVPGPVRVSVRHPRFGVPSPGDVIDWIIIDPQAPEPTEFYGEWSGVARLDLVAPDHASVGWGGSRVVVEGEILGRANTPIGVENLQFGDRVVMEVVPSVDPALFYAQEVWLDPSIDPDLGHYGLHAEVRAIDGGDILVGDWVRDLTADAVFLDQSTGESLSLADFAPGDLVEFTVVQTDVGELVNRLTRNPELETPPEGWVGDAELVWLDPPGLVWLAGPAVTLAPGAEVTDEAGAAVGLTDIEQGAPIVIEHRAGDYERAVAVQVVPEDYHPDRQDVLLLRFDRFEGGRIYTIDYWARPLAREADISFGDGSPATVGDLLPGPVRVSVRHPLPGQPSLGDVIDWIIIDPLPPLPEPPSEEEWLTGPSASDLSGDGEIDGVDYKAFVWFIGRDAADLDGDGDVTFRDFQAYLLDVGAADPGTPAGDSPIVIDLDPEPGDQERRQAAGGTPGREYLLELHGTGLPQTRGWSVTVHFDPEQLAIAPASFAPSGFIPGSLPLVRQGDGEIGVGTTVLLGDGQGGGDAILATLKLEVLEGFTGTAQVEIVRYGLRPVEGDQLFQAVSSIVTITDELLGEPIVGDYDGDGIVDFPDFFMFADAFWTANTDYDLTGDGFVDFADFFVFADYFGQSRPIFKLMALARQLLGLPVTPMLDQNYPNPFNSHTAIPFGLPASGDVQLVVYDVVGQRVRALVSGGLEPGLHRIIWDGRDDGGRAVAAGVYLYRLVFLPASGGEAGAFRATRKLVLTP